MVGENCRCVAIRKKGDWQEINNIDKVKGPTKERQIVEFVNWEDLEYKVYGKPRLVAGDN